MGLGLDTELIGNVHPSSVEKATLEAALWATRITEIPSNMQARWAYNADGTLLYSGFAPRGLAEGTDGWLLQKFTYDANLRAVTRTIAYGDWTNRATETYA